MDEHRAGWQRTPGIEWLEDPEVRRKFEEELRAVEEGLRRRGGSELEYERLRRMQAMLDRREDPPRSLN